MAPEITLQKRHFTFFAVFAAMLLIIGMAGAYNDPPGAGVPSEWGHSVDELNLTPLYINPATSRVGIGTTNPTQALHVVGGLNVTGQVQFGPSSFNYDSTTDLLSVGSLKLTGAGSPQDCNVVADIEGNFECGAGGGAGLWIDDGLGGVYRASGSVGIGAISGGAELSVVNDSGFSIINISSPSASISAIDFYEQGDQKWGLGKNADNDFYIGEPGNDRLLIDAGTGYVGIGTVEPNVKLDVDGVLRAQGSTGATAGSGVEISYVSAQGRGTVAALDRDFIPSWRDLYLEGTNIILGYNSGGNVGIGTTNPQSSLQVESSAGMQRTLDVISSYSGDIEQLVNFERTGVVMGDNDILQMAVPAGAPDNFQFVEMQRGSTIEFSISGNGDTFINGNVGIGTTSPSERLDVSGNIVASGTICDSGGTNCIGDGVSSPACVFCNTCGGNWPVNSGRIYSYYEPTDAYGDVCSGSYPSGGRWVYLCCE